MKTRLGVYSRIRKSRRYIQVQQHLPFVPFHHDPFSERSPKDEFCRSLSYRWTLDVLPFLLERSEISLELAQALRGCTFAMMASGFPRSVRLAKKAMAKYLLRVESAVKDQMGIPKYQDCDAEEAIVV